MGTTDSAPLRAFKRELERLGWQDAQVARDLAEAHLRVTASGERVTEAIDDLQDELAVKPAPYATAWRTGDRVTWGTASTGTVIRTVEFGNGCQFVAIRRADGHATVAGEYGWLLREGA